MDEDTFLKKVQELSKKEYIDYLKPKSVLFTHMTALIDEQEILKIIPSRIKAKPGWDGLEVEL